MTLAPALHCARVSPESPRPHGVGTAREGLTTAAAPAEQELPGSASEAGALARRSDSDARAPAEQGLRDTRGPRSGPRRRPAPPILPARRRSRLPGTRLPLPAARSGPGACAAGRARRTGAYALRLRPLPDRFVPDHLNHLRGVRSEASPQFRRGSRAHTRSGPAAARQCSRPCSALRTERNCRIMSK